MIPMNEPIRNPTLTEAAVSHKVTTAPWSRLGIILGMKEKSSI